MSGFAALWWFDGRPARSDAQQMLARMVHRGPDGTGLWAEGGVALAHAQLATTPEALFERQPLQDRRGACVLSMDGRVDNRPELLDVLGSSMAPREEIHTDADLVLAAYERWGVELGEHVIGDFALVVWDGPSRRLVCVRDTAGVRPFYYHHRPGLGFAAASEPAQLLCLRGVGAVPDEGMVAELLAGQSMSLDATLYCDVKRLPPGHVLWVDVRGCTLRRYFRPEEQIEELRLESDEAYAERFGHVFRRAVRDRSRSSTPLAAHLSGGLDSSSVCAVLASLRDAGQIAQPAHAWSLAFPGLDCDETPYAEAVAAHARLPWQRVAVHPLPRFDYAERARRWLDVPGCSNGTMLMPMRRAARDAGQRVELTGLGGDHLLFGSPVWHRALSRHEADGVRSAMGELRGMGVRPLLREAAPLVLPERVVAPWRRRRRRAALPAWLRREWVERVQLPARLCPRPERMLGWSLARRYRLECVRDGWTVLGLEIDERTAADMAVELRHPFFDRRVVELSLALPEAQCARGPVTRWVLRRALGDQLPRLVRERVSKAEFSHTIVEELIQAPPSITWSLADTGWIDPAVATACYLKLRQTAHGPGWPIWLLYAVHLWFQAYMEVR